MKQSAFLSSLTIAIPAFNEESTVSAVVEDALRIGKAVTKNLEVLLVDDGSTDQTRPIMDSLEKSHKKIIRVIHHTKNKGFSGAMKSCYTKSSKEWIFLIPADGQVKMQ